MAWVGDGQSELVQGNLRSVSLGSSSHTAGSLPTISRSEDHPAAVAAM